MWNLWREKYVHSGFGKGEVVCGTDGVNTVKDRDKWLVVVNAVINFSFHKMSQIS
jgi:hypothetical protein